MKIIYKDFLEFLKLLKESNVQYLIVGGYAVAYHGYPRMTMDIDIWIKMSGNNSKNIVKAIRKFGFKSDELKKEIFETPNSIVRMGVKPQLIEIITTISGVEFDDCYERRIIDTIEGIEISIISLSDLRKNKISANRPEDIADLSYMEKFDQN